MPSAIASSSQMYQPVSIRPIASDEADDAEQQRRDAAEPALEQHRARDVAACAGMPAGRLEDAHGVTAEGRRQHLARRVRDEVRAEEPADVVVDPADGEQLLPAPGQRDQREDQDRERRCDVPEVRARKDVGRRVEVDPRDDVPDAQTADDERRAGPRRSPVAKHRAHGIGSAKTLPGRETDAFVGQ